jgi:type I restriction enzyme, S subunit
MPSSWEKSTLAEVCTKPQYGWTSAARVDVGAVKLLRTTDITSGAIDWDSVPYCVDAPADLEKYQLKASDIVISRAGSVGVSYFLQDVPQKAVFASYLIRFCPLPPMDARYVALYLRTSKYWSSITDRSAGIALQNVNAKKLETIEVPVAPAKEQARIVSKLDELLTDMDAGVKALERARANLKRYRAAVLKAAVEGRLTDKWRTAHPGTEPAGKLLERILAERRKKWQEAQLKKFAEKGQAPEKGWKDKYVEPAKPDVESLPDLPRGWCWTTVESVGDILLGRQRAPQYLTGRYTRKYLRVANIKEDRIDFDDIEEMDFDETHFSKYRLVPGDILVSEGQSPELVGQSAIFRGELEDLCFQKTLHRYRALSNGVSAEYAQLVFRANVLTGVFRRLASITTNIAHLTLEKFCAAPFPLAPAEEQTEIVRLADQSLSSIEHLRKETQTEQVRSGRLRQSILKRAFEGRLVPQDPKDEPARELLKRIRVAREADAGKRVGAGVARRDPSRAPAD